MNRSGAGSRSGVVAAPEQAAREAGTAAFEAGGSAIDAALAAAASLCVSYPHNVGLGGDAVCLIRSPDGTMTVVNATGAAPDEVDVDGLRRRHGHTMPHRGIDSVSVPGGVAAWSVLHDIGGRLPWRDVFRQPIELAGDGVHVAPSVARNLRTLDPSLLRDTPLGAVFAPGGRLVDEGDLLRQPALADSLRALAADGTSTLYGGALGETLVDGLRRAGSPMTLRDLSEHRAETSTPISHDFVGHRVHTSAPNTSGFMLLRTLDRIQRLGLDPATVLDTGPHVIADEFRLGNRLCDTVLADPRSMTVSIDDLADSSRLRDASAATGTAPLRPRGDTVGVSAMDDDGFAVSIVQSLFFAFGSAVLEPETGIILHNRGSLFSLDPSSPNLVQGSRRPRHTLMPVITEAPDGQVAWVMSTMGGPNQPQIHTHVLLRLLAGVPVDDAVRAPRWLVGPRLPSDTDQTVYVESDVPAAVRADLRDAGFSESMLGACDEGAGHMNVVGRGADGGLEGASDPRADGSSAVTVLPGPPA